jgi:hypothetical protein
MKRLLQLGLIVLAVTLALVGCSKRDAAAIIEQYLRAKVEKSDAEKMVSLSCVEWEAMANTEATSFASIDAEIQEMECEETGTDGEYTVIACEGSIMATYGTGDTRELELGGPYRAIQEDGEWKMCGMAE